MDQRTLEIPKLRRCAGIGRTSLISVTLAIASSAAAIEPSWRVLRPGNTGLGGEHCESLVIDANNRPWISGHFAGPFSPGGFEGGISRLNGDTWWNISNIDFPAMGASVIHDMERDADGVIWAASDGGLLRIDPNVDPPLIARFNAGNSPLVTNVLYDLDIAPDGSIWIAMVGGFVPNLRGGLVRLQPESMSWTVWRTGSGLPWAGQWPGWDSIHNVAIVATTGENYAVWFTNTDLATGKLQNGTFSWFGVIGTGNPNVLQPWRLAGPHSSDRDGHVWMSTNQGPARRNADGSYTLVPIPDGSFGISRIDALPGGRALAGGQSANIYRYDGTWGDLGPWGGGPIVGALREDAAGTIWLAAVGGAARYSDGAWQRYRQTNTGMMDTFSATIDFGSDGRVFLGGNYAPGIGGFNIFDGARWVGVNDFNYGLGPAWGLGGDIVRVLKLRENGRLLLAAPGQGLHEWDGSNYTQLIAQGYDIVTLHEDSLGRVWAGRDNGSGMFRISATETVEYFGGNSPYFNDPSYAIFDEPTAPGTVWIAAATKLYRTDGDTWSTVTRPQLGITGGELLFGAARADDGTLWVGSEVGAIHHDPTTGANQRYTTANSGLPTNVVREVEIAPDGGVWLASMSFIFPYPGGLSHFDGETWTTYRAESSPLQHNQIEELAIRPIASGYELWVGASAGGAITVLTIDTGLVGDTNCDGVVSVGDISSFVLALTDPAGYALAFPACEITRADINADGVVSVGDIGPFVAILTGM